MLYWMRARLDKLNCDAYIYVYNIAEGVNSPANGAKRSGGGGSGVEWPARYTKAMNHAYLVYAANIQAQPVPSQHPVHEYC
jgi:hypothetical protein